MIKHIFSKRVLHSVCLLIMLVLSTSVFAFGGGGHGRESTYYKRGIHALGIHQGDDVQPDIDFRTCNEDETEILGVCCPNRRVMDEKTCVSDGEAEIVYAILNTIKTKTENLDYSESSVPNYPEYRVELDPIGELLYAWVWVEGESTFPHQIAYDLVAKLLTMNETWYIGDDNGACKKVDDLPEEQEYLELVIEPTLAPRPTPEYRDIPDWSRPLSCGTPESTCDPCVENDGWPTLTKRIGWGQACTNTNGTTGQCTWNTTCEDLCTGVSCGTGTTCSMGKCVCPNGEEPCNGTCCPEGQICGDPTTGICVAATGDCTSNHDCAINQYCAITPINFNSQRPGCATSFTTKCIKRTIPAPSHLDFNADGTNETILYWGDRVNFWSGINYCHSFGKELFDHSNNRLNCFNTDLGTKDWYVCCADGQCAQTSEFSLRSTAMQTLTNWRHTHVGSTTSFQTKNTYLDCRRYYIHLGYGSVAVDKPYAPYNTSFVAVCE